jgi:hypothetical protein
LGKLVFQNKLNLNFLNAKYNSSYNNLLYKSPFSSLSSYYLAEKYNMKVVVLIRHPAAFYYSMKKRGWHMNPEDFLKQKTLIDDYLDSIDSDIFNFDSKIEKIINEWKVVYSVLLDYILKSDNFIPVRHMDICYEPLNIFRDLFQSLNLEFTEKIENEIISMTSNQNNTDTEKKHDFNRNSKGIPDIWKKKLSKNEKFIIKEKTEELSKEYFDNKTWD